jgi:hypothetical protein
MLLWSISLWLIRTIKNLDNHLSAIAVYLHSKGRSLFICIGKGRSLFIFTVRGDRFLSIWVRGDRFFNG